MIAAHFLKKPFVLQHALVGDPLFELSRVVELAESMPRDGIEYNSGKVAVNAALEDVPKLDMPAEAVIKSIKTANALMVIKRVEKDPAYKAVL